MRTEDLDQEATLKNATTQVSNLIFISLLRLQFIAFWLSMSNFLISF